MHVERPQPNTDLHHPFRLKGTGSGAKWIPFAGGKLRQANADLWVARNARVVVKAADPFDSPEKIVIRKGIDRVNGVAHWGNDNQLLFFIRK